MNEAAHGSVDEGTEPTDLMARQEQIEREWRECIREKRLTMADLIKE